MTNLTSKVRSGAQRLVRWRTWTVVGVLTAMLVLPALLAGVGSAVWVRQSLAERSADHQDERLAQIRQGVVTALAAVQAERATSVEAPARAEAPPSADQVRTATNSAAAQLSSLVAVAGELGPPADEVATRFARLDDVRGTSAPAGRLGGYASITTGLLDLDSAIAERVADPALAQRLRAAHALTSSHEYLSRQQVLIDAVLSGKALDGTTLVALRGDGVRSSDWRAQFEALAPADALAAYSAALPPGAARARDDLVAKVLPPDGPVRAGDVTSGQWRETGLPLVTRLGDVVAGLDGPALAAANGEAAASVTLVRFLTITLAVAVTGTVVVVVVLLRRLRSSVKTLRNSAADIADKQLPVLLRDVRDGRADGSERPQLPALTGSELDGIGKAFGTVCGEAIDSAAEQARMRAGYSEVFVTMFRRGQTLMQRQLALIEKLELNENSPEQLANLYQLDHLVTRMRRNNENVLVLSGTELVRRPAKPVPLVGVVQAATAEIEQYRRVDVVDPPSAKIVDSAANDLIRMLAELLDNATSFSAPDTHVTVQGQVLRDGSLSIAVVDNGIGMTDDEVLAVNERLTRLGSAELAKLRRVGLLVVGRLAGRHGFGVELMGGDRSAGVTAIVTVPADLVVEAERPGWADRRIAMKAASARHAPTEQPATGGSAPGERAAAQGGAERRSRRLVSVGAAEPAPYREVQRPERVGTVRPREAGPEPVREPVGQPPQAEPELPVRVPNRLLGKAGADGRTAAERAASGWFRARNTAVQPREASVAAEAGDRPEPRNWISAADEGWNVVETVARESRYSLTEDGLPVRERGAHLMPGSARRDKAGATAVAPTERDPARTRSRIAGFQQGVRKAKGADDRLPARTRGWTFLGKKR